MSIIKIIPFQPKTSAGSGISIALGDGKSGQFVRIGLSSAAQAEYFGGALDPTKDAIRLSIDSDAKKRHLLLLALADPEDADAIPLSGGVRGSISLRIAPYLQIAPGKRPSVQMPVTHRPKAGEVSVKLPEWARPEIEKSGAGKSIMEY